MASAEISTCRATPAERVAWVDDYARNIARHVHVRTTDNVLIKVPNNAYRLNAQGARLLRFLLDGGKVRDIIACYPGREAEVARDIHAFATALRLLLKGCWNEQVRSAGIERIPFVAPYTQLPVLSEVALTYRCNLRCRFCYAGCGARPAAEKELSTRQWRAVIDRIRDEAEVPSVSFTGGEPTLRDDLPELVRHAKARGMWTNLISNGTLLTERLVRALQAAGLDSAQISIEGADAARHDAITGGRGAFGAAWDGIARLRAAGIRVHTNTTISALNRDAVEDIVALARARGMERLSMNLLMPCGSARRELDELLVSYRDIGGIVLRARAAAQRLGIEFMWYSPTPLCLFNPVAQGLGNKGCAACDGLLSIAPDGSVLPCSSWAEPVGNMCTDDFAALWRGAQASGIRAKERAPATCRACGDLAVCTGACPLYWEAVGTAELERSA